MKSLEEPSINLTSLIDVVFVILIMFMVVAPMLEMEQVDLPSAPEQKEKTVSVNQSPLALYVKKDNTVWIDAMIIPQEKLKEILMAKKRLMPQEHLQVFHDKNASFGTYQMVKNAAEAAGFEEMDIVLQPN